LPAPETGKPSASRPSIDPAVARVGGFAAAVVVAAAALTYVLLRRPVGPPPAEIAGDPLLVAGREVYLSRCVSCHGEKGRGDGPIAKGLSGPPVGDLTDAAWKHGDRPDQVLEVVSDGVRDTAMPGWGSVLDGRNMQNGPNVRAVTAYVYHLAGRDVPAELRRP
jgi:cytochrome c oxidase cbb3-type subunit 3